MGWLVFMYWVISQANEWEDYSKYFEEGTEISKNGLLSTFWFLTVQLEIVMALVGVSWLAFASVL